MSLIVARIRGVANDAPGVDGKKTRRLPELVSDEGFV